MLFLCFDWSESSEKKAFYAQLQIVVDLCPEGDNLIVLGDLNATSGTGRDGYTPVLGLTAPDQKMKAFQCSLTLLKVNRG